MIIENIIKNEIVLFINEFYGDDEPSLADKWYEKKLGISPNKPPTEPTDNNDNGKFIGIITHGRYSKLNIPAYVFKNPRNLKNFDSSARGLLLKNGDFYLMQSKEAVHDELIIFLIKKNILPSNVYTDNYGDFPPEEYIAVKRWGSDNAFFPSLLYNSFPDYYENIFELANKKHMGYKFYKRKGGGNTSYIKNYLVDEQLDMNRAYSYHPRDLDPNRNFGRPF